MQTTHPIPMDLEAADYAQANRELGQQGMPGSLLYAGIWGLVMTTTPVSTDLAAISWWALLLLALSGIFRLALGLGFDRLHGADPRRWLNAYYAVVLFQAVAWGGLLAYLVWHYRTDWPAMFTSFATAGIVAGGTISMSTHRTLQRAYIVIMLLPSALAGWASGDNGAVVMGFLFAANIGFLLIVGQKLDRGYWQNLQNTRLLIRRNEELEEAREKAEAGVRAKSQFVAKVSHELRTPLNGLIGTIGMLHQTDSAAKRVRYLDIMAKSAQLLLQRINEILDFSKMEAGKLELESLPMHVSDVVRDAVSLMQDAARAKGVALRMEQTGDPAPAVLGDASRLSQVLLNLISNAIKFTPHGTVVVALHQQLRDDTGVSCRFVVTDPGIGIAPEAQQRIFESFEQADGSTMRQYGGTGLGLAVSRDLVRLMNGGLGLESAPGEGSAFTFAIDLPLAAPGDTAPPAGTDALADPGRLGLHVLIAEDNPVNQYVTEEMLAALGCSSDIAADGADCVSRFSTGRYDAILMDCEMPGMDGYAAARRIRELEATDAQPHIPIIALTAHADAENRQRTEQAGMTGFVTKPVAIADLLRVLQPVMVQQSGE